MRAEDYAPSQQAGAFCVGRRWAMHIRVHRPVICHTCAAEMSEFPGWLGWFRCVICGAKRREDG